MKIGVLNIQGSVEEHVIALKKCGVESMLVKSQIDLEEISGLIIPGGESTTIGKLLKKTGLLKAIRDKASLISNGAQPLFIWGTCAGAILLAKKILKNKPKCLNLMNIKIMRNAYGRQTDSFETNLNIPVLGGEPFPGIFIRAPKMAIKNGFLKPSASVEILAHYEGLPVMAKEKNFLVTMFHPELTKDLRIHKYFISLIKSTYARNHRTIRQRINKKITEKRTARRTFKDTAKSSARV